MISTDNGFQTPETCYHETGIAARKEHKNFLDEPRQREYHKPTPPYCTLLVGPTRCKCKRRQPRGPRQTFRAGAPTPIPPHNLNHDDDRAQIASREHGARHMYIGPISIPSIPRSSRTAAHAGAPWSVQGCAVPTPPFCSAG